MEQDIRRFLSEISPKWRARKLKDHPRWSKWIQSRYPSYTLAHATRFFMDGLASEPRCQMCEGVLKLPHHNTCSTRCRDQLKAQTGAFQLAQEKARATMLDRYGVENPAQSSDIQARRLCTMQKRYGAKVSERAREATRSRAREMNQKGRETLRKRHGVDNPGQLPDHHEKCRATLLEKHGVDNYFHSAEWKKRRDITVEQRWQQFSPPDITVLEVIAPAGDQTLERIRFCCDQCEGSCVAPTETYKWRIRNAGTPCKAQAGINHGSIKEQELANWIQSLGVTVVTNCRETLANRQELDIVVPEHQLAIEFCGLFWHNDLRLSRDYHLRKLERAQELGLRLITVFEDEWDQRPDVVKNRILQSLNISTDSVGARECEVVELEVAQAREFLDQYHLQGYAPCRVRLGLKHNDTLLMVMTFGALNRGKGYCSQPGHWELIRFSGNGISVPGGASRLFAHFVRKHKPQQVLSFSDRRWGDGSVYASLGFERNGATLPGYWYIHKGERIHRYRLRKNQHDDPNKTEYENRLAQGYLRIWDCGHTRWKWTQKQAQ